MLFRKMLIQELKKTFSIVGADLLAIRRIKPDYLSVSVTLFLMFSLRSIFYGQLMDRISKNVINFFKEISFKIEIETNLKMV